MKIKVGGFFDGRNNIIKNVKDPVDGENIVSKKYIQSFMTIKFDKTHILLEILDCNMMISQLV